MENAAEFKIIDDDGTDALVEVLSKKIARLTKEGDLGTTAIPGLSLFCREAPTEPFSGLYEPSLCLVTQGSKRVLLGDDTYTYDARNYLITSIHLPTMGGRQILGLVSSQGSIERVETQSAESDPFSSQSEKALDIPMGFFYGERDREHSSL